MSVSPSDTYSIVEPLSYKGRSILYRGVRNADRRPVVLKVLDPKSSRPKDLQQLKHEYEIGRLFDSSSVVRPLALQTHEGMLALVMEDFGATSLDHLIDGPMAVERFLTLASRIAVAVAEIHCKDIVHRDLKPANILVGPTGEVKLGDLGMALQLARGRPSLHSRSRIEGSLPYLSPEQTGRMNRSVDSRSDLYALGVTFYEMLTGELPFQASDPLSWVHCHVARTPRPPQELVPDVPAALSAIVLKLLAKLAEDRYQTARGLQHDLDLCLAVSRERVTLPSFPLGQRDVSDRFEIAEKLYGREAEIAELVRAFEGVVESGASEFVLVSGYSGIGKSSLVRELHRPIVRERGFFVAGKFDQYKRDIPYATFAQAFADLIEQLLAESEERVAVWKTELQQALGTSGQLLVDVIPQLELIIGPQPAIVPLPPVEAQNRFRMIFRQFVGVFARKEHPLALFLDDLQWLDSESLQLIEDVILHPQTRYLLLLGAYRDNEVGRSHPLMLTLDRIRRADAVVREIVVTPLGVDSVEQIIVDALRCSRERAAPLARLVQEKTAGNPFFVIQFLKTLYQEGLLEFDRASSKWRWDTAQIEMKGFTDNVLDLMARKLSRLRASTRDALKLAACIGSSTDLHTLAIISKKSDDETARDLWDAVSEGLVLKAGEVYTFLHDRVQQGAYALIGDAERKSVHLEIGRLLLRSLDPRNIEERIFDVVSQLNRGVDLIADAAERDALARLDLLAGRKAKASIAYASARNFLASGAALLPEDAWESRYDLTFQIFMERAECEYLSGAFEHAGALFEVVQTRARSIFDKAAVYELRVKLCQVEGRYDEAVAVGFAGLRLFGIEIPDDDDELERAILAEVEAVKIGLGDRKIADLVEAKEVTDPSIRSIICLLANLEPPTYILSTPERFALVTLKLVNYSLRFGHTQESCVGYSCYGLLLVWRFDDPRSAYEFSEMSIALNQRFGDIRRRGTVLHLHGGHINFWTHPVATNIPILERALLAAIDEGDLVHANFVAYLIPWYALERGDTVDDVLSLSEKCAAFARDSRNEVIYQSIRGQQQFLAWLKGGTRGPTSFDDASFDEETYLAKMTDAGFRTGINCFHVMKLIAAILAGDDALAIHHAAEAERTLPAVMAMPQRALFYYLDALLLARTYPKKEPGERPRILERLRGHEKRLAFWASICPENFLTRHALVAAEIARITGDELKAERCYEEAIRSARASAFVHWQALANELAGRFHQARGFELVAMAYLREALYCYQRWGAETKVAELGRSDPELRGGTPSGPTATSVVRADQLDLLSVVKASQSISGVMVEGPLLRTLLQLVLELGGARHACLILPRDEELTIAAEADVEVASAEPASTDHHEGELGARVPLSVVQYVLRTERRIVLDDAPIGDQFASDPYFARVRPRSMLCLPIRRQDEVVALLYLENDLVPGAFTVERLQALSLLAAQAAISLENAFLLERERAGRVVAEVASRRALLLAEGTALMSSTLDYEALLTALTQLCVRSFADWAVIDLLRDGRTVRLAGAHRDPAKEHLLRELCEHYPAGLDTSAPAAGVLRAQEPTYLPEVTDEYVHMSTVDARHAELIVQLGTRSAIIVPLLARDTLLGTLMLVASSPCRFELADVELAAELGRRTALAMDNARLLRDTQRALRLREEFLSLASHELRTPLTPLRLVAETLSDATTTGRALPRNMLDRCLRRIVRETARLDNLSGELLDVTLIERGELSLEPARVDLPALVHEVVMRLEAEARAACCAVSVTGDESIVGAWDRRRIAQVVKNLLSNAFKFGAGRPIEVHLSRVDGVAQLAVIDQGIGIEQASLSRVFDRFERGVSVMRYGGLGLGLYITRWIVRAHGGSIRVESRPGTGSKFTVDLPYTAPAPAVGAMA